MLMLDYVFNTLGLRKVTSKILDFNGRSQRYAEKCGYRQMARIEKEHFRNGEWVDELLYVVFREDWLPFWNEYEKNFVVLSHQSAGSRRHRFIGRKGI